MELSYLLDTNCISDYLGARLPDSSMKLMDEIFDSSPAISIINKIELLGHNYPGLPKFQLAVEACQTLPLSDEIVQRTIAIRKSRKIRIPDAIIAATALDHSLTLITHNIKDFKGIYGLKLLDLHEVDNLSNL